MPSFAQIALEIFERFFHPLAPRVFDPARHRLVVGARHREPVAGVVAQRHPVIGHSAKIGVTRAIARRKRVDVALENAPDRQRLFVLIGLEMALAAVERFGVRNARRQREGQGAERPRKDHGSDEPLHGSGAYHFSFRAGI